MMWWRWFVFLYVVVLVLAGCGDRPTPDPLSPEAAVTALPPDSSPIKERLRLCEAWLVHAKVVGQDPAAGWVDIALELKDERKWVPQDQGRMCIDLASFSLAFPSEYLEYRGEYCKGPSLRTDGQTPVCDWIVNNQVQYDQLPHPRGRLSVMLYDGSGGVPMPAKGKRIIGTARFWRTGVQGTQKTYSYYGMVDARFEHFPSVCRFAARSAWGHELTFGPPGTPVIVGPETQFCTIYPGCNRELTYCDRCPQ